jgi:Methyltransferase domain
MSYTSIVDGVKLDYAVDLFTLFRGLVFISGSIRSEREIAAISLLAGSKVVPFRTYDASSGIFAERIDFVDSERSDFHAPRIQIVFTDGGEIVFSDFVNGPLSRENFWNTANIVLDRMRKIPSGVVLEIGSRARSGISRRNTITPPGWKYIGFDVFAGENVDVVGDAHEVSSFFPADTFDAVVSLAVLEHIMMPWKFVIELNRVLKTGAIEVFVSHQAYPVHDQPWNFWRYTDSAWAALLNVKTGFEIIEAKMAEPAYLVPQFLHAAVDHNNYMSYQSSTVVFRKISNTSLRWDVKVQEITATSYPAGELPLQI